MMQASTCRHGLPSDRCGHCKRPTGHTFEIRRGSHKGSPIVEILKDGGPVHPFDSHFEFGREKARLLLTALPIIKDFIEAGDAFRLEEQVVGDGGEAHGVIAWVKLEPEFVHSSGQTIHRPYLCLRGQNTWAEIGIGYEKAKAIQALADEVGA